LGFLYAAVSVLTVPYHYEIEKYKPEKIEAADWEKIKRSTTPYRDEDTGGKPIRSYRNPA
jgi:hypothetical protein